MKNIQLGVNVDHVATLRNARGEGFPDVLQISQRLLRMGADHITMHLREDRRHIRDDDVAAAVESGIPLHLEMAPTKEMSAIARRIHPKSCCLVPESREELTTEGGLDVVTHFEMIKDCVQEIQGAGMDTALFIDADMRQLEHAVQTGARAIELHTGGFCHLFRELGRGHSKVLEVYFYFGKIAKEAQNLGLAVHAGHGLNYDTAPFFSALPQVSALNIGHFLVGQALLDGFPAVIGNMLRLIHNPSSMILPQEAYA